MNNTKPKSDRPLQDVTINVKVKLAALWAALMFFYAYGDILALYQKGTVEDLLAGSYQGVEFNEEVLMGAIIFVTFPIVMIFLSTTLPARINRWANIILGLLYILPNTANLLTDDDPWVWFIYLHIAETIIFLLIAWHAWKWPRAED